MNNNTEYPAECQRSYEELKAELRTMDVTTFKTHKYFPASEHMVAMEELIQTQAAELAKYRQFFELFQELKLSKSIPTKF